MSETGARILRGRGEMAAVAPTGASTRNHEAMKLLVQGIATPDVAALRAGGPDANGQPPLVRRTSGAANPCRHCLQLIPEGQDMLVLAYRPFASVQPYAETGPIFLHRQACERYESDVMPDWFIHLQPAIVRGYDAEDSIRYDTGQVVPGRELAEVARRILTTEGVGYVHIRSKFNCFQCRVDAAHS